MVAKSFQKMKILCDPYEKNGKMYVRVLNEKTGNEREVRSYSEEEYAKMYKEPKVTNKKEEPKVSKVDAWWKEKAKNDPYWKSQKELLGFSKGYITIFKGNTYENKDYLKSIGCVYRKNWGWGLSSELELPSDLPEDITPVRLDWNKIGNEEGILYRDSIISNEVDKLVYDPGESEWVGNIGERLDLNLTIIKVTPVGDFDVLHIMEDADKNTYLWKTSTKELTVGETYHMRGTVKEHKLYHNNKQTVLTRCLMRD